MNKSFHLVSLICMYTMKIPKINKSGIISVLCVFNLMFLCSMLYYSGTSINKLSELRTQEEKNHKGKNFGPDRSSPFFIPTRENLYIAANMAGSQNVRHRVC